MSYLGRTAMVLIMALPFSTAMAADLPTNMPAPLPTAPAAPVSAPFSWTGFFAGANGGYSYGKSSNEFVLTSAFLSANVPDAIVNVDNAGSQSDVLRGGIFGIQAGYNYQVSDSFVLGAVASGDYTNLNASIHYVGALPTDAGGFAETLDQSVSARWTSALQAKIGFVPIDRMLIYAIGGIAAGQIKYTNVYDNTANETEYTQTTKITPGWTAGAGIEYAFAKNWSLMAQYNFTDYRHVKSAGTALLSNGSIATTAHSTGALKVNTFRVGLNYLLN